MPLAGFGTWGLSGRSAYEAVRASLDAGYQLLDTATMYGNETEIGAAIREGGIPRDELVITTKLPPENAGWERETIAASLDALGLERVDLWLVHWPPPDGSRSLVEIARRHGLTPTQVVVRWHVQHEIVVIPKSSKPDRIVQNIDVWNFELPDEEMRTLDALRP